MQTKKLVLITILITLALIHNVNAETGNTNGNVSESETNNSFINMTGTDYANETKDEGAITDKLNIDAPETVEAGKEYKIKVTDKSNNPAENIKLDIFIGEEMITTTTNKEGIAKITPNTTGKIDRIFALPATGGDESTTNNSDAAAGGFDAAGLNDTGDEGTITDKLNIDAPETVEAGKEYKIKVTDKQGNPAKDIKLDIFISESLITVTTNKEGIAKIIPKTSGKIDGIFAFEATESGGETVKWDGNETTKTNENVKDSKKPSDQEPNHNNYIIIAIIVITIFVSAFVIWYKKFKK